MSFRFDVKVIKIPNTKPIVILAKGNCTFIVLKVQNFNNKKLVYLGLVKMLFRSLKGKVFCVLF
jgi:hypothetical protein